MAFWRLTPLQREVLLDFVANDTVWDLGCGDLQLTRLMAQNAKHVFAIDKERPVDLYGLPPNVTFQHGRFNEVSLPRHLDCVVVCWPQTDRMPGLVELVNRAFRVVYIGCNTGGSACGSHDLWLHLTKRMLHKEVRDERNCLHLYSLVTHKDPQFRSEEEVCGLLNEHGRFRVFGYNRMLVGDLSPVSVVEP